MLVLSRQIGEAIRIGKDVLVTLVKLDRSKIRLGITAPKSVPVYREELLKMPQLEEGSVRLLWTVGGGQHLTRPIPRYEVEALEELMTRTMPGFRVIDRQEVACPDSSGPVTASA